MIGLLIVSHSRMIAEGVRELAEQVAQGQVPIAAAGGLPDGRLGTSAEAIRQAADALVAAGVVGILALADLGSAVMSAEIALEGLDLPYLLPNAPLVEGAVLAVVEASIGADLSRVAAAAEGAKDLVKAPT